MRKAFTLIELVVALAILALILSFAGIIFRVSIGAHRLALANTEIMQKLRVITQQLDADFKGGLFGPPYQGGLRANTYTFTRDGEPVTVHSDTIAFLTSGDFQSTEQFDGETIMGNTASIFYGQPDPNSYDRSPTPQEQLLLRRQTILAAEVPAATPGSDPQGEYYAESLAQWRIGPPLSNDEWSKRPLIDPNKIEEYQPMLMAQGVGDFMIHYLQYGAALGQDKIPWRRQIGAPSGTIGTSAFKFTFTLYDSKGVIRNGRTFTHIVVLGN